MRDFFLELANRDFLLSIVVQPPLKSPAYKTASEILMGCKGRSGSLEMIGATTRCLQSPSDQTSAGRKAGFVFWYVCVCWVRYDR